MIGPEHPRAHRAQSVFPDVVEFQKKQDQIDEAVSEWYTYTLAKADEFGIWFNKKTHYFLNIATPIPITHSKV